jgi:hypothetical protein
MAHSAVQTLVDRWLNDNAFRSALRANPEGAVRGAGIELDASEWAALRSINWDVSDGELEARLNKSKDC